MGKTLEHLEESGRIWKNPEESGRFKASNGFTRYGTHQRVCPTELFELGRLSWGSHPIPNFHGSNYAPNLFGYDSPGLLRPTLML